jgi:hypothetical protein
MWFVGLSVAVWGRSKPLEISGREKYVTLLRYYHKWSNFLVFFIYIMPS